MNDVYILAIESSCDEFAVAIVKNGNEIITSLIATQIKTHTLYGGVVPEIASRLHVEDMGEILNEIKKSFDLNKINAIAVTQGPRLITSLLVGITVAKTLSMILNKPLIKVNHLAGHLYATNLFTQIKFPTVGLLISGGHTEIIYMEKDLDFEILGETQDDACGEAFDKVARLLNIGYPGGPKVEKLAKLGKPNYTLPTSDLAGYNMSFSGLKSATINLVHNMKQKNQEINQEDLAFAFQETAFKQVIKKTLKAAIDKNVQTVILAGGVAANDYLRSNLEIELQKNNIDLIKPDKIYCTDNAAMIGACAYQQYLKKDFTNLKFNAKSQMDLGGN